MHIRKITSFLFAGLALTFSAVSFSSTSTALDLVPVEEFARLPLISNITLSPDGAHYAAVIGTPTSSRLLIKKIGGSDSDIQVMDFEDNQPGGLGWGGPNYLVTEFAFADRRGYYATKTTETRLNVINMKKGKAENLIRHRRQPPNTSNKNFSQIQSNIISYLPMDEDHILVALDEGNWGNPDVFRVDLEGKGRKRIVRSRRGILDWLADPQGHVRIGWGYRQDSIGYLTTTKKIIFRPSIEDDFKLLDEFDDEAEGAYDVVGFTEDPHIIVIAKHNEKNRLAIYTLDTRTMETLETIFSHEKYDVEGIRYLRGSSQISAVYYTDDSLQTIYLNPNLASQEKSLARIFPSIKSTVTHRSHDGNLIIARTGDANKPSRYYLIDIKKAKLEPLGTAYPELAKRSLPVPKAISFQAQDGTTINGYLTIPNGATAEDLPMIVHPHGGPTSRDTLSFDPWVQFFASRGWAVLQVNFRGSTGYGKDFQEKGDNEWGRAMQDDITDGVLWAIEEGIVDPNRICIVGASYGAYAAIQGVVKTPELYACAVGLNGLYDLKKEINASRYYANYYFEKEALTHENLQEISPINNVEKITSPVLIAYSQDDRVVDAEQSARFIARLKKSGNAYEGLKLKNGGHSITAGKNRLKFFRAMDKFLQKHLGLGPAPAKATHK